MQVPSQMSHKSAVTHTYTSCHTRVVTQASSHKCCRWADGWKPRPGGLTHRCELRCCAAQCVHLYERVCIRACMCSSVFVSRACMCRCVSVSGHARVRVCSYQGLHVYECVRIRACIVPGSHVGLTFVGLSSTSFSDVNSQTKPETKGGSMWSRVLLKYCA
jgi:hypothetical protein